jgi:hypothetical protein
MQVEASKGVRALIASTMPEVWQILHSGVVEEGKVDDVSEPLPLEPNERREPSGGGRGRGDRES